MTEEVIPTKHTYCPRCGSDWVTAFNENILGTMTITVVFKCEAKVVGDEYRFSPRCVGRQMAVKLMETDSSVELKRLAKEFLKWDHFEVK